MSTMSLTLPHSLQEQVEALAQKEGISVSEFITLAVAEKLATLTTADYIIRSTSSYVALIAFITLCPSKSAWSQFMKCVIKYP